MKAYSQDLRARIVRSYLNKEGSQRQLAARYSVSLSFVRDLLRQVRETGELSPKPHGGGRRPRLDPDALDFLGRLVQAAPRASLDELGEILARERGVRVSRATLGRARLRLSRRRTKIQQLERAA